MKLRLITSSAIVLTWLAGSVVAKPSCEEMIAEKEGTDLPKILDERDSLQKKLADLDSCAANFDAIPGMTTQLEELQNDQVRMDKLFGELEKKLDDLHSEIVTFTQQLDGQPDINAINVLITGLLKDRQTITQWPLRNGPEMQVLENKRNKLEDEINWLQTQIGNVSNWPDREQLNNLILEEDRLTLTLTKLQSRLTALKQDRSNPEYDVAEQLKKDGPQRVAALEISVQNLRNELDALQNEISGEEAKLGTTNSVIAELDNLLTERTTQFNTLKAQQTNSTSDLAGAQIEKSKLVPLLQSLEGQETVLNANAERLRQQTEATQSITDQLQASVAQKTEQVSSLDKQIESDSIAVEDLKARIDAANQSMALIRNKMATEFKPLSELKTVDNQIFALEDTIDGLDKEIDTLDMRVASAEGKLNRFTRACNREPACKAAIN